MESRPNMRGNIYNQSFRGHHKKKSIETRETNEFPNIKSHNSLEKNNNIRNQVNDTKEKITEMEARLNKLRKLKEEFEVKTKHNLTKAEFMRNVKERVHRDREYKQNFRQKRHESLMQLKGQVGSLRDSLVREKKQAEEDLYQKRSIEAEEERRKQKQHDYLMKKLKELDRQENAKKVQKIRQFHEQSASRIKQFYSSRVSLSKENYQKKVTSTLKEKEKANRTLSRLKSQEQQLIQIVKNSEQTMLTSLYSLVTVNPEKKMRRSSYFHELSSRTPTEEKEVDVDNYENQEFQT